MTLDHPRLANWQPPPEYLAVPSLVEGITIYAPQQVQPARDQTVNYKCPQCGATTHFDIAAGGVACRHCGYQVGIEAKQVGRRAQEFEFTLETMEASAQGWGVARRELHCDSCGANLTLPESALTISCPFCASNKVNLHPAPSDVLRPRYLIPFSLEKQTIRLNAQTWLGKGWFHPSELSASAVIDRFHGIYLPFWTFDAFIIAYWKAQVGYERQESYYDSSSKTWKTRTVIDWRWEDGQVALDADDLLIPGSSRVSRILLERLLPYNLEQLTVYNPDYLAGWEAQAYDIDLPGAWDTGKSIMREQAKQACYNDIRSAHVRNFSMKADFSNEAWRYILLPVYLAAYRFEDKVYQVMVNGQTGVVAGQKPVAWWKIWLAIAGLFSPGSLLGIISLPFLLAGGIGIVPLLLAFILLLIGGGIAIALYKQAAASEAA
jgi:DNA-directed RNA polymerase subunit RPC12/RpoP